MVTGPIDGSTFPNDGSTQNSVNEGTQSFNTESGHDGGTEQGLNIVNENGERVAQGTDPNGNPVEMTVVNVHSGVDPANNNGLDNRGSAGCPTVCPSGAPAFFEAVGLGGGSATGGTQGNVHIFRGESEGATQTRSTLISTQKAQRAVTSPRTVRSDNTRVRTNRPIIRR